MLETLSHGFASAHGAELFESVRYILNGKHLAWYASVRFTLIAAFSGALLAIIFGLLGAAALRSPFAPLRLSGLVYTTMIRGIPLVLFFLFFPLAFEQTVEYVLSKQTCSSTELAQATQWPPCAAAQWHLSTTEYLVLACISLGIVNGSFVASVIHGALSAVPHTQLEAARAFGFSKSQVFWKFQVRQMWVYALPGLSNVWLLLLKATSLLSLLQIPDIVLWAGRLGAANYFPRAGLVHPDWRWRYYLVLLVFYIVMTLLSEKVFQRLFKRASRGLALNVNG